MRDVGTDLRKMIDQAGGLHTIGGLAERWGVSRQRAQGLSKMAGFPEPVLTVAGVEVYAGVEADAWRASRPPAGRPRKVTTT